MTGNLYRDAAAEYQRLSSHPRDIDELSRRPQFRACVNLAVLRTVAETYHTLAEQGVMPEPYGDESRAEMHGLAERILAGDLDCWWTCPICEELECDGGCPLSPVREAFAAESGHPWPTATQQFVRPTVEFLATGTLVYWPDDEPSAPRIAAKDRSDE